MTCKCRYLPRDLRTKANRNSEDLVTPVLNRSRSTRELHHSVEVRRCPIPGGDVPGLLCAASPRQESNLRARDRSRTCDLLFTRRKKPMSASVGPCQKVLLTWAFAIPPCRRVPVDNAQLLTVR